MAKSFSTRPKADTVAGQIRSMQTARMEHAWPELVPAHPDPAHRTTELAMYRSIMKERSFDDWSEHSRVVAGRAASTQAMIVHLQNELQREGLTELGGRHGDTVIASPRLAVLQQLNGTLVSCMRQLGLGAPVQDRRDLKRGALAERDARDTIARAKSDPRYCDLLA